MKKILATIVIKKENREILIEKIALDNYTVTDSLKNLSAILQSKEQILRMVEEIL